MVWHLSQSFIILRSRNHLFSMPFHIEKPKTWKGLSYVLKSSWLITALEQKGIDTYVQLVYYTRHKPFDPPYMLFEAEYWPPNLHVDHYRFYIRTGVVLSTERKKAETLLLAEVLPKLIEWMELQIHRDLYATKSRMFCAYYGDSQVQIRPWK